MIGGSVGGLFAAHLLREIGWDAAVFERARGDLGDRGTGIGTRDDLFRVMRRVGLAGDAELGVAVAGRTALARDGSVVHELTMPAVTSAWSRIWRPLRQAWPEDRYRSGKTLARVEQQPDAVQAFFEDGSRAEGDLLVGADGLHSAVRAQLLPGVAPAYAGYVAWRGAVVAEALAPTLRPLLLHRMVFAFPKQELMLSIPMPAPRGAAGARACHFVWFRPVEQGALAGLCTDANGRQHGLSIPPPLIRRELIAALRQDAADLLAPQLAALVEAAPQIILQPIFDLESTRIAFDRVALIGDAAFVARPHVATGVMKAAIDAETLANALTRIADIAAALRRYNDERRPYGASLVARGRHIGRAFTDGPDDPHHLMQSVMREYGAAGLVGDMPITAGVAN